jgi:ligand-binding SRPBCC domain-containing protein
MKLQFTHEFPVAAAELFAFHENPGNLGLLLTNWLHFKLLRHAGSIRPNSVTIVQEQFCSVPFTLEFEHFVYEPPRRFGERQIRGLFRKFQHIHEFVPTPSGTKLTDHLDVQLPWYLGGDVGVRLIVAPRLRKLFAFRHRELERLIANGAVSRALSVDSQTSS